MPRRTRTPSSFVTAFDEHKEVLLPMPIQSVSQQRRIIDRHLKAAWTAGWVAGAGGVRRDSPGKDDYAEQVGPLCEQELLEPATAPSVLASGLQCAVGCGLPREAHDPHVGLAGHEFTPAPTYEVIPSNSERAVPA